MGATDVQILRIVGITATAWGLRAPSGRGGFWMCGVHGAADTFRTAKQSPTDGDGATARAFSRQQVGWDVAVGQRAGERRFEGEGVMA